MRKKLKKALVAGCCLFLWQLVAGVAVAGLENAVEAAKKGDEHLQMGEYLKAVKSYRQAIDDGLKHPDVYRNLSIALYDLRRVDDAITTMEEAVRLNEETDLFHMELGILYLVKNRFEDAKKQLVAALTLNPGLAEAHYFLGQIFHDQGHYALAWIAGRTAEKLGYDSRMLIDRLTAKGAAEPKTYPWSQPAEKFAIRQLKVASREDADKVLAKIKEGELFEYAGDVEYVDATKTLGGYAGLFRKEELRPQFVDDLKDRKVYDPPSVIRTDDGFHLVQKILPFDLAAWQALAGSPATPATEKAADKGKEEAAGSVAAKTEKAAAPSTFVAAPLPSVDPPVIEADHERGRPPQPAAGSKMSPPAGEAKALAAAKTAAEAKAAPAEKIAADQKAELLAKGEKTPADQKAPTPKPEAKSASKPAEAGGAAFFRKDLAPDMVRVYVLASYNRPSAEENIKKLRSEGYDAAFAVVRKTASGGEMYSIVAGEYADRQAAGSTIEKLKTQGYTPFLSAHGGVGETPPASGKADKDAAAKEAKELKEAKETKEAKEPPAAKDLPETKETKESPETKEAKETKIAAMPAPPETAESDAEQKAKFFRENLDPAKSRVYVGASFGEESALMNVRRLQGLGFPAFCHVSKNKKGKTMYSVIAGEYDSREEAASVMEQLKAKGFSSFLNKKE